MGSNVVSTTKSEGQGILDIEEELMNAIERLDSDDGSPTVKVYCRAKGAAEGGHDPDIGYIAWRDYDFEALVSTSQS